jgi:hypothetical protein
MIDHQTLVRHGELGGLLAQQWKLRDQEGSGDRRDYDGD